MARPFCFTAFRCNRQATHADKTGRPVKALLKDRSSPQRGPATRPCLDGDIQKGAVKWVVS